MDTLEETSRAIEQAATFHGELQFYLLSFALACFAGLVRTHRDNRFRNFANLVSIGLVCGFIGFGCVAFLVGISGGGSSYKPLFLAISVFIGLSGKEADKYIPLIIEWALRKVGIEIEDKNERPK